MKEGKGKSKIDKGHHGHMDPIDKLAERQADALGWMKKHGLIQRPDKKKKGGGKSLDEQQEDRITEKYLKNPRKGHK